MKHSLLNPTLKFVVMTISLALLSCIFGTTALASEFCPTLFQSRGQINVQQLKGKNDICYLSVYTRSHEPLYRSYVFSSDGIFLVFNNYGFGDQSTDTGARVYHLFPRKFPQAEFHWDESKQLLRVRTVSGQMVSFNLGTAELISFSGAKLLVSKDIDRNNKGGVEVSGIQEGLLLDSGFRIGGSPTSNPLGLSTFSDGLNTCRLQNKKLFKYTEDLDVVFKFEDVWLREFLKQECPKFLKNYF